MGFLGSWERLKSVPIIHNQNTKWNITRSLIWVNGRLNVKLMDNSFKQQDIYSTGNRAPNMRERTLITCISSMWRKFQCIIFKMSTGLNEITSWLMFLLLLTIIVSTFLQLCNLKANASSCLTIWALYCRFQFYQTNFIDVLNLRQNSIP